MKFILLLTSSRKKRSPTNWIDLTIDELKSAIRSIAVTPQQSSSTEPKLRLTKPNDSTGTLKDFLLSQLVSRFEFNAHWPVSNNNVLSASLPIVTISVPADESENERLSIDTSSHPHDLMMQGEAETGEEIDGENEYAEAVEEEMEEEMEEAMEEAMEEEMEEETPSLFNAESSQSSRRKRNTTVSPTEPLECRSPVSPSGTRPRPRT